MVYSGAWGKLIHEKNQKQKISWHCPFKLFKLRFQTNQCRPHPVRSLELFREYCFYHLQTKIASKQRYSIEVYEKIRETPRGEFKHCYWLFADAPNIARNFSVIWNYLWWRADSYHLFKYRGWFTIKLFQLSVWCEKGVAARHYSVIGKQLQFANDRNRVCRWV